MPWCLVTCTYKKLPCFSVLHVFPDVDNITKSLTNLWSSNFGTIGYLQNESTTFCFTFPANTFYPHIASSNVIYSKLSSNFVAVVDQGSKSGADPPYRIFGLNGAKRNENSVYFEEAQTNWASDKASDIVKQEVRDTNRSIATGPQK